MATGFTHYTRRNYIFVSANEAKISIVIIFFRTFDITFLFSWSSPSILFLLFLLLFY